MLDLPDNCSLKIVDGELLVTPLMVILTTEKSMIVCNMFPEQPPQEEWHTVEEK